MKKIVILLSFITLSFLVNAQVGDGSAGNPFRGVISTAVHWTYSAGTIIYIGTSTENDLTVGTDGHLTIDPGITLIFTQPTTDLIITGTGILTASGTSADTITFTKAADESNWGHISFQSMGSAGHSLIDYCIIEYGDVRNVGSVDNPFMYGGAIHAAFSNLTISNCLLQYNKAKWGGAIFVNKNSSPNIMNCHIRNNESARAGGGLYFWDYSGSIVENCLVESNACKETITNSYSGGGLCAQSYTSVKVVNCTFVNNTTTRPLGAGIELYSSGNARVINTILWGSGNQLYLLGTAASTIVYSAIQGSVPTGSVHCIVLNSSNSDPAGPNFTATDGSDWSIKNISPCVDAGTDTYTGVTIPPLDYIGNSRVRTTDIGAYESIISDWKITASSTDWMTTANWNGGVPASGSNVIIPTGATNYPTGSSTVDFTIETSRSLTMEPGSRLTLNSLTNNGKLKLNSLADGFASLILGSYTRGAGGTEEIQIYLTGGGEELNNNFKWHYISSPVATLSTDFFAPGITLDLAQWIESRPAGGLGEGWLAFDGYNYSTGFMTDTTFSTFMPGIGYDFYDVTDNTITFDGILNTSDVYVPLGYSGTPSIHGFNLLGNPFSSGLDWDYIINNNYPANTSKSLYFTRNNVQCSYVAGAGSPSDVNGIIPPMQGFF
ncbi:MAG: right-handed parallel beta-helix repeat-containing protein, partial [Bacteroidales bacterium]